MKPNDEKLSLEERRKRFYARLESGYYSRPAKPKVPIVAVPVTAKVAEAVRANPESVRVSARSADGTSVFGGPQHNAASVRVMVEYVREVDADGRPVWDQPVVSDYDPLRGLR
jgi:hypothetical protein